MLPTGQEKLDLIQQGIKNRDEKYDVLLSEKARKEKEEANQAAQIFRKKVDECRTTIEKMILLAIRNGKPETSFITSRKHDYVEAWNQAVKEMAAENREYFFSHKDKIISCDNAGEAANVDYVSYRQWTEKVTELKIHW